MNSISNNRKLSYFCSNKDILWIFDHFVYFIMHNLMNHFCVGTKPMKGNEQRYESPLVYV